MGLSVGVANPGSGLTVSRPTHATATVAAPRPQPTLAVGGGGGYQLSTSSPQSAGSLGGTFNPQQTANIPPYYPSVGGAGLTGADGGDTSGTGGSDPAATQAAALKAQADAIKGSITGLINNIKGVYDALYGDVTNVAADKTNQVTNQYGQDVKSLTDQFNTEFPKIGQGYGARGTYDSSYRINAEKGAQDQFGNANTTLAQGRDQDLAKVGQYLAEQQAQFGAQKGGLDAINAQIAASENPDELTSLQNTLTSRLADLSASRASNQTQASYLQTLNSQVPVGNRIAGLQTSLTNVLNSAVPAPIKLAIAGQLVSQSGLSGTDTDKLLQDFQQQVGISDKNQLPA